MYNRNLLNESFSNSVIEEVWQKGFITPGYQPHIARRDVCGALMHRSEYGNRNSIYGWEVDHIKPKAKGGGDEISNLQPLHWRNNSSKGDDYPATNFCVVRF